VQLLIEQMPYLIDTANITTIWTTATPQNRHNVTKWAVKIITKHTKSKLQKFKSKKIQKKTKISL